MKKSTNKYNYCKLHFVLNLFLLLLLIKFGNSQNIYKGTARETSYKNVKKLIYINYIIG